MLKARVRNVLGVKSAELDLQGVVLIAGRNGAGKSSLVEAITCATLGTAAARGQTTKKAQAGVLHEGASAGSASLDWGTGTQRVLYPEGKVETTGVPPALPLGSPLGMGAVAWSSLDAKSRASEFSARAGAKPTRADLEQWLADHEGDPADADALMERIDVSGWDAVHRTAAEAATKLKGAWEQVTGEAFGAVKANGWRPAGLLRDEDYALASVEADLAAARADLERLIAAGAVDQGRIELLRPLAATLAERQAHEQNLRARIVELRAASGKLSMQRLDMLRGAADLAHGCPHCRKAIEVVMDPAGGVMEITKSQRPTMTAEQLADHNAATKQITDAVRQATSEIDNVEAELADAVGLSNEATEAAREVDRLLKTAAGAARPEALAQQRMLVAALEARVAGVKAMIEAGEIFSRWARAQPMIQALASTGVRAAAAQRALTAWNEEMAEIGKAGAMPPIALADDLTLTMNGRPYALLSESERWRCDALMSVALARKEGAALVVLDRLDVLVPDARAQIFRVLAAAGLPAAVVACSARDRAPETLPSLKKAGLGSVWWMEAGTLIELPY